MNNFNSYFARSPMADFSITVLFNIGDKAGQNSQAGQTDTLKMLT